MIAGNDVSDGQSCPETITRTWTYTDACGNAATETQTIIVDDTTPPTASNLATISILGGMPLPIVDPLVVNDEADNCTTSPVVAFVSDVSNNGNCPEIVTRSYSITDDCGNQSFVTQLISIGDAISPSASNPTPINVQCSGDVPAPDPLVVTDETDNGMMPPVVTFENDASNGQSCPETITRTYRITDDCGNFIFVTQAITVHDTQAPVFNAPPVALSVQCQGDVPAMADLGWMDNCDGSGMATGNDVSDGQSCPETITRTWTYTDACGNSATETQIITVQDTIAPVMDAAPVDITVACIGDVPVMLNLGWTVNCDGTGTVTGNDLSDGLSCPETITRTWMHTDACGNMSTTSQTITVFDTLAPTASAPATANVECISDVPVWDVTAVTNVADNCSSNPIVAFVSDVSEGLSCPVTITSTYSVTDDCGNSATFDQLIIVNDVTAPTASNPAPVSVPGAGDVPVPDALVVIDELDNCTTYPTVAWVSDLSDGNVCNGEIITRTYSITDDCGNQSFVTQEITILAAPAPIDAGPDQTICAGDMVTIAALNPWNAQLSWSPTLPSGPFAPTQTTTYTCTADNEGCMSTDQITITIEEPPLVSFMGDVLSGCAPHTVTFTNTSSSVSGMADCIWNINGQTVSACNTGAYTFDTPGTYDVTLTTTSLTGCTATETYSQYIYVEGNPEASFTASQTELSTMFTEVSFDNTSQGASSYTWTFGDNSGMSTEENPSHTYPETPGTYNVELTAYSNLGCMDVTSLVITVNEDLIYYIPNSFTPDGDDYNESFSPVFTEGYDPFDFHMMIYNRWGEIVWESYDASVGWDGTYGYGGSLVQDGTYTWHIEFKVNGNDERKLIAGHVNVLR
jgi:gliding motility-associated-like protein